MMRKKILTSLLGITVILILVLSITLRNGEEHRINNFGVNSVGTLTNIGLKTIQISYSYQGKNYDYTRGIPFSDLTVGEKYQIRIYTKDPSRIILDLYKPVIDTAKFKWMTTNPSFVKPLIIDRSIVEFKYVVYGTKHRRLQKWNANNDNFKRVDNYSIVYRFDNPDIAYLTKK